jgi:hypothetical protein
MRSHFAFLLSLALPVFAATGWDKLYGNCTAVSFDELEAIGKTRRVHIGSQGIYSISRDGACVYMDASPTGTFAIEKPDLHADFVQWLSTSGQNLDQFDFLGGRVDKRAGLGCQSICDGSGVTRVACNTIGCVNCVITSSYNSGTYSWWLAACNP